MSPEIGTHARSAFSRLSYVITLSLHHRITRAARARLGRRRQMLPRLAEIQIGPALERELQVDARGR
jgi:hypothetical protein